jgi:hypothetical protein
MSIDRAPHTIVTLVHGTFTRDAPWTHPDSKLSVALRTALDGGTLIESFDWSGRNSHAARAMAARDLVERLRDRIAAHPDAVHHIVAHSHGGNVAMHALRQPDLQSRVGMRRFTRLTNAFSKKSRTTCTPSPSTSWSTTS